MEDEATRLALVESELERHETRITEHGKQIDQLRLSFARMETTLSQISGSLASIDGKVTTMDEKLDQEHDRPGTSAIKLFWLVAGAAATACVAYFLGTLGVR